jgi:hypothetical protein
MSTPAVAPKKSPIKAVHVVPLEQPAWKRLFFTKYNEMDLGYFFLIPFLALFYGGWIMAATGHWTVSAFMWSSLVTVITAMLVATVPKERARIMRDRDYQQGSFGTMITSPDEMPAEPLSIPPTDDAR